MSGQDCEQLTLFPEDSHASRSALPGSETARTMTVTSGRKCSELLRNCGPAGWLVKMLLESSIWRSKTCYLIWKPKATKAGRLLFRLVPSMPRTGETASPLWPTMRAKESGDYQYSQGNRGKPVLTLSGAVKLWPTPTSREYKGGRSPETLKAKGRRPSNTLCDAVNATMYPTPTTGAGLCGGTGSYRKLKAMEARNQISPEERKSMVSGNGGQLNPAWVEWLMGFPIGWTDLNV